MNNLKKMGLIINPIAGMGGKVGLKGTDGVLQQAKLLGAIPESANRASLALDALKSIEEKIQIVTCSGSMGEDLVKEFGFDIRIIRESVNDYTSRIDTIQAAKEMVKEKVDLLLFAGGDGTARDIYFAIKDELVVVGIPTGVKIHSAVFAINPQRAGEIARKFIVNTSPATQEVEIMDIDEGAFREDVVKTKLYGYVKTPFEKKFLQVKKAGSIKSDIAAQWDIAHSIVENMEKDTFYIIGPGSTTRPIMQLLDLPYTLLGVDLIYNKRLVKNDLTEKELLETLFGYCKIIITPIGGQGYIFGRGNQQISAKVIEKVGKENIIIIATRQKLQQLKGRSLLVDTDDRELDKKLEGYVGVVTGYGEKIMNKIES